MSFRHRSFTAQTWLYIHRLEHTTTSLGLYLSTLVVALLTLTLIAFDFSIFLLSSGFSPSNLHHVVPVSTLLCITI